MQSAAKLPSLQPLLHRQSSEILRIAHRGGGAAEKYASADLADLRGNGAHMVEVDLHVTGDDQLVARHDPVVEILGKKAWLADRPVRDFYDALRRDGTLGLEELVQGAASTGLGLYLDIKTLTMRAAGRLVAILAANGMTRHTIMASVRSDIIICCSKAAPHIPRSVLFASTLEDPVQLAKSARADFVHPCWERLPRPDRVLEGPWLERVRKHGLGVLTWHEERPEVLRSLCHLGVDGICTDLPGLLTDIALNRVSSE